MKCLLSKRMSTMWKKSLIRWRNHLLKADIGPFLPGHVDIQTAKKREMLKMEK